jgi:hypothetical protein
MATLIGVTAELAAVLAAHVPFELVNWCGFRPTDDIKRHGLVGAAAEALDFKVPVAGVERISQRRRWLGRPLESEHALVPGLAGELVGIPPRLGGLLSSCAHGGAIDRLS